MVLFSNVLTIPIQSLATEDSSRVLAVQEVLSSALDNHLLILFHIRLGLGSGEGVTMDLTGH